MMPSRNTTPCVPSPIFWSERFEGTPLLLIGAARSAWEEHAAADSAACNARGSAASFRARENV
jgi:hypothetical protein